MTEVTEGYEFAVKKALEILPGKLLLNWAMLDSQ